MRSAQVRLVYPRDHHVADCLLPGLICWKIWRMSLRVSSHASDRTTIRVFEVVIETGTTSRTSLPSSSC